MAIYRNGRNPDYVKNVVRYCFSNPIVREFWQLTIAARRDIPAIDEHVVAFERICDEVYYEASETAEAD
jgi:hypothetical protein